MKNKIAVLALIALMVLPIASAMSPGLDVESYRTKMNRTPTQLSGVSPHIFDNITIGPAAAAKKSVGVSPSNVPTTFNQRQIVNNHDVQKAMLAVCMREAGILSCVVNVTNAIIEIVIQRTGDNDTFHKALESIIVNYAWFADKSTYNGNLRIILDNSQSKMIDEWNTTAVDAIAHVQDETIGTGWVESVINASSDATEIKVGEITPDVSTVGRESPTVSTPMNQPTPLSQVASNPSSYSNPCDKVVNVSGYTTKKGKYVAPYDRRPPGCD